MMLKEQIEELKQKAIKLIEQIDATCTQLDVNLVSLHEGHLEFIDNASGMLIKAELLAGPVPQPDSVESMATVGQPGILLGPAKH